MSEPIFEKELDVLSEMLRAMTALLVRNPLAKDILNPVHRNVDQTTNSIFHNRPDFRSLPEDVIKSSTQPDIESSKELLVGEFREAFKQSAEPSAFDRAIKAADAYANLVKAQIKALKEVATSKATT